MGLLDDLIRQMIDGDWPPGTIKGMIAEAEKQGKELNDGRIRFGIHLCEHNGKSVVCGNDECPASAAAIVRVSGIATDAELVAEYQKRRPEMSGAKQLARMRFSNDNFVSIKAIDEHKGEDVDLVYHRDEARKLAQAILVACDVLDARNQ